MMILLLLLYRAGCAYKVSAANTPAGKNTRHGQQHTRRSSGDKIRLSSGAAVNRPTILL